MSRASTIQPGRTEPQVVWGIFSGPLAWVLDHGSSYSVTQHACAAGNQSILYMISVTALLIAASGLLVSTRAFRNAHPRRAPHLRGRRERVRFQSVIGIGLSASFLIVIIANAVPRWLLSACS